MKIQSKIWKTGNSFVIAIPKAIIDGEELKSGDKLTVNLEKIENNNPLFKMLTGNPGILEVC